MSKKTTPKPDDAAPDAVVEQAAPEVQVSPTDDAAASMEVPAHQQRVRDEKAQLDDRLDKLQAFMASPGFAETVPDADERSRLADQANAMLTYQRILACRINYF